MAKVKWSFLNGSIPKYGNTKTAAPFSAAVLGNYQSVKFSSKGSSAEALERFSIHHNLHR